MTIAVKTRVDSGHQTRIVIPVGIKPPHVRRDGTTPVLSKAIDIAQKRVPDSGAKTKPTAKVNRTMLSVMGFSK